MGKKIEPFFNKCFLQSFRTASVSFVPSGPDLQLIFLNQGDFFATNSEIPDTSLIMMLNLLFFQGL